MPNNKSLAQLSAVELEDLARQDLDGALATVMESLNASIIGE